MRYRVFILIAIELITFKLFSQQYYSSPEIDKILESMADFQDEDPDYELFYEEFLYRLDHPLDINMADREDLRKLFLLSDMEINRIMKYRNEYGPFFSIYELGLIEGVDSVKINRLKPFIRLGQTVERQDSLQHKFLSAVRGSIILRYARILEKRQGFTNRKLPETIKSGRFYLGSPEQLYSRFSMEVNKNLRMGITFEKDPGEYFYLNPKNKIYGFDHYAGFIQYETRKLIKKLILGDFRMDAGQGLVMGGRIFSGKSREPIATVKSNVGGLRPYQGGAEYGFYRGLGWVMGQDRWLLTTFISRKGIDAIISEYEALNERYIRGLPQTGLHRTPMEIERRFSSYKNNIGTRFKYRSRYRNFSAGISFLYHNFEHPVLPDPTYYNQFYFRGKESYNAGFDYDFIHGKYNVFGEIAFSYPTGLAFNQAFIANISSEVEALIHLRHYGKKYISLNGKAFSEFSNLNAEDGIYFGLRIRPLPRTRINVFFDIFRNTWMKYNLASLSAGAEWMVMARYQLSYSSDLEISFRTENKSYNESLADEKEYQIYPRSRNNLRLEYQLNPQTGFLLFTRLQGNSFSQPGMSQYGFSTVQDIGYRTNRFSGRFRIAYFNINDYLNRQYIYEHDLLYFYSVPSYYGHGLRYYIILSYKVNRHLKFWIKAGRFHYFDREETGSGLDMIDGNKKTEIRCQVQLKF